MTLLAIQTALAKVALSLQALLLIISHAQQLPQAGKAAAMLKVQTSLGQITMTLQNLATQLSPVKPALQVTQTPLAVAPMSLAEVNAKARLAVVNILCSASGASKVKSVSGSGVVIDDRGVILTNAHVAQYFLLKDFGGPNAVDCTIRTGNPAEPTYKARPLYISPAWVEHNKEVIYETKPTGTGEDDFALLLITGRLDGKALGTVPALTVDTTFSDAPVDNPVLVASYPAELTGSVLVLRDLPEVTGLSKIIKGYFFSDEHTDRLDLIDVGGSVGAQGGSSGGAIVDLNSGKLIGVIVTTTSGANTGDRELFAITTSHIARSIKEQSGHSLGDYLSGELGTIADEFAASTAPHLRDLITASF